jgi:hypothetical protein
MLYLKHYFLYYFLILFILVALDFYKTRKESFKKYYNTYNK